MGTNPSKNSLIVGTLNFSGICFSPFEYHDCSVEKDFMSSKFQDIMAQYIKDDKFVWDVGKIDQKMLKERYTPVYRNDVGVGSDGKLVNRPEFQKEWKDVFERNRKMVDKSPSEEQVRQMMLFDWIAYETFLNVVYNQSKTAIFDLERVKNMNSRPLVDFLKLWHSRTYLDNKKKMFRVKELTNIRSLDVLCLQEAEVREDVTWRDIFGKQFQILSKEGTESVIILKTSRFPGKADAEFEEKYHKHLNFNEDSIFTKRGKYLIISGHLSSKQEKYFEQAARMFEILNKIVKDHKDIQIILGIDCNHFMNPEKYTEFNITPNVETQSTTIKKRTAIQVQSKKTNLIVMETKDQIVSTLPISRSRIEMIDGKDFSEKTYLPCESHPYDHFLVWAELFLPQTKV